MMKLAAAAFLSFLLPAYAFADDAPFLQASIEAMIYAHHCSGRVTQPHLADMLALTAYEMGLKPSSVLFFVGTVADLQWQEFVKQRVTDTICPLYAAKFSGLDR